MKNKIEFYSQDKDRTRDVSNFCQLLLPKVDRKHERLFFPIFENTCVCLFYFKTQKT